MNRRYDFRCYVCEKRLKQDRSYVKEHICNKCAKKVIPGFTPRAEKYIRNVPKGKILGAGMTFTLYYSEESLTRSFIGYSVLALADENITYEVFKNMVAEMINAEPDSIHEIYFGIMETPPESEKEKEEFEKNKKVVDNENVSSILRTTKNIYISFFWSDKWFNFSILRLFGFEADEEFRNFYGIVAGGVLESENLCSDDFLPDSERNSIGQKRRNDEYIRYVMRISSAGQSRKFTALNKGVFLSNLDRLNIYNEERSNPEKYEGMCMKERLMTYSDERLKDIINECGQYKLAAFAKTKESLVKIISEGKHLDGLFESKITAAEIMELDIIMNEDRMNRDITPINDGVVIFSLFNKGLLIFKSFGNDIVKACIPDEFRFKVRVLMDKEETMQNAARREAITVRLNGFMEVYGIMQISELYNEYMRLFKSDGFIENEEEFVEFILEWYTKVDNSHSAGRISFVTEKNSSKMVLCHECCVSAQELYDRIKKNKKIKRKICTGDEILDFGYYTKPRSSEILEALCILLKNQKNLKDNDYENAAAVTYEYMFYLIKQGYEAGKIAKLFSRHSGVDYSVTNYIKELLERVPSQTPLWFLKGFCKGEIIVTK